MTRDAGSAAAETLRAHGVELLFTPSRSTTGA
jgi:hypothetical protein